MKYIKIAIILCILIGSILPVFTSNVKSDSVPGYTIRLKPSFDTSINSTYVFHNSSNSVVTRDNTDTDDDYERVVVIEWDTSPIPSDAVITEASLMFNVTAKVLPGPYTGKIMQITYKPTLNNGNIMYHDGYDGKEYETNNVMFDNIATVTYNTSTGDLQDNGDIIDDLNTMITAGKKWFAVGVVLQNDFGSEVMSADIGAMDGNNEDGMILWVEYEREVLPPNDIDCEKVSSTSINVTFNDDPPTSNVFVLYKKGGCPTTSDKANFLAGTFTDFINSTNGEYAVITGLDNNSCYGLSLISVYNNSGTWYWSSFVDYEGPCCTFSSNKNLFIRFENTSVVSSTVQENNLINLSKYSPCATHRLITYYEDGTSLINYINSSDFTSYPINFGVSSNDILYFELWWNYTINSPSCNCEDLTPSYRRLLTANAMENNSNDITFYFTIDKDVYYDTNCTGTTVSKLTDNLARYGYEFTDESGLFKSTTNYDSYFTIYASNITRSLPIYEKYFDSKMTADNIVLVYDKQYFMGVNRTANTLGDYSNIEQPITNDYTSPYLNPIKIPNRETEDINTLKNTLSIHYRPSPSATGMYVFYQDTSSDHVITKINCTIYNYNTSAKVYVSEVNSYTNNFTYAGANFEESYLVVLNLTHTKSGQLQSIVFVLSPYTNPITTNSYFNDILIDIFGELPSNPNTGIAMNYVNLVIFVLALMIMSTLAMYSAGLASIGCGFTLIFGTYVFASTSLIGVGAFLIFMGITYIFIRRRNS